MYSFNKHNPKIIPVLPAKQKNFLDKSGYLVRQLKYLIGLQALLGDNRLYLLKPKKILVWTSYIHTFSSITMLFYSLFQNNYYGATYIVFKCTSCIEFFILVFTSTFIHRKTQREFFKNLESFDTYLKIDKEVNTLMPSYRNILWVVLSSIITVGEYFILIESQLQYSMTNLTIMVHDAEQIFFCAMLRAILLRVRIVKAHVVRVCNPKDTKKVESLDKVEVLSKNVQIDISSLHEVYESLHRCSEQLNSVMSLPMMTMLLSSGLSTIILLKYAFAIFQSDDEPKDRALLVFILIRCIKYTALVIIPCYYSSMTTTQVSIIRKTLHDALNNTQFEQNAAN
ncbi:uncharacterized protein isoform X2 [Choristoneura fumiferana]|uniref:uncharacterized protein isoform X2 n=1 Tax=Choristoneura fumiferana TaxID=7141 RepID=UPI003D15B6FA